MNRTQNKAITKYFIVKLNQVSITISKFPLRHNRWILLDKKRV